jgi:hypothetical protein
LNETIRFDPLTSALARTKCGLTAHAGDDPINRVATVIVATTIDLRMAIPSSGREDPFLFHG